MFLKTCIFHQVNLQFLFFLLYPPFTSNNLQAELAKLTQHESSITQLIKVAKNLIKESPELDVLVQEPMFRLEVEWKRLYNLMQCCNTQLKIYEENLPFYRILNSITKNTNDINELLLNPNKVCSMNRFCLLHSLQKEFSDIISPQANMKKTES